MLANISGMHLILLLVVILLIFGAARLPALAKGVGQSVRILKTETKDLVDSSGQRRLAPGGLTARVTASGADAWSPDAGDLGIRTPCSLGRRSA